ncbi:hypothetical protein GCM10023149_37800 [Mucilaginibacter gynuensis]|uniref:Uncharacterized protein n=1 Tax=Mucilaginibacter gynuensis TaxID=1302236 RepID=A0ABP8GYJ5_9SPHI
MKKTSFIGMLCCLTSAGVLAQKAVNDEALRYQQERMVFQQWDKNKFKPSSGFLGLNPYYWATWGLFFPSYHKKDRRPLSNAGPQSQRLALVALANEMDNHYKLESDTLGNSAKEQVAAYSGVVSGLDPLWVLYYSYEFEPLLDYSTESIFADLAPPVREKLISSGLYGWYIAELDRIKQRVQIARSTDMARGGRIMAYYRLLKEYRSIAGIWKIRSTSIQTAIAMEEHQKNLKNDKISIPAWTPTSDIEIAKSVLKRVK